MELVLHDVAFGIEIGEDVDGGVGDEERFGICRHIEDEDVADAPRRAQAGLARRHLAHELVRVQAALHQQLAFGLVDQLDRFCRRGVAVRHVDDLVAADIETMLASDGRNLRDRSDENRNDDPGFRRLDGAAQRGLFAGMNDDGRRRRDLLGAGDQSLVLRSQWIADRTDRGDIPNLAVLQHEPSSRTFAAATLAHDAFACSCRADEITVRLGTVVAASSRPNAPATRCMRLLSSSESGPLALKTCLMRSNALRLTSPLSGSIDGSAASAASVSSTRIANCSRTSALKADNGMSPWARRMRRRASKPRSSTAARPVPT